LVGKPEMNISFRSPRHRWKYSIKVVSKEIGWELVSWIHVVCDRDWCWAFMNTVMNLLETISVTVSFPRRILLHGVG
jgi:hypothetical protein